MATATPPAHTSTLADLVFAQARTRPDRVALIDAEGSLTWSDLAELIDRLSSSLTAMGVRRGHRVAVADTPSAAYVALYFATASRGAVLCPLNTRATASELASLVGRLKPHALIVGPEFADTVSAAAASASARCVIGTPTRSWCSLLLDLAQRHVPQTTSANEGHLADVHMILFTSGTASAPKGVLISQQRSLINAFAAAQANEVTEADRVIAYQPLFHTGGWDMIVQHLAVGASAVILPRFDAAEVVSAFRRWNGTTIFGVPLVLDAVITADDPSDTALGTVRHIGFACFDPTDLMRAAGRAFTDRARGPVRFHHVYGQTEAGSYISVAHGDRIDDVLDHVGRPVPGAVVALLDERGHEVEPGEPGEVCLRGPAGMDGYLDDPAATAQALRDGWFHTGDLAIRDTEGRLTIVGRIKDLVRTGGENVAPREVEQVLLQHPAVAECAVFGLPDDRYDEVVAAAIVCRPGASVDAQELREWARGRLAGYKLPRAVVQLDALPRNQAGKLARTQLIDQLRSRPTDTVTTRT